MALVDAIHDRLRTIDLVHGYQAAGTDLCEAVIFAIIVRYVLRGGQSNKQTNDSEKLS